MVLCSCRVVRRPLVLWVEREAVSQSKDYIIDKHNALNALGYIARAWAHYNTFRRAPFPREMSQSASNCTNQSPNQIPMRPRRYHSCASQRYPYTMHNTWPASARRNCGGRAVAGDRRAQAQMREFTNLTTELLVE